MKKALNILGKVGAVFGTTVLIILITLLITIKLICSNISESAKELFATTMLETGQLKFMASIFLSKDELQELVNRNSMADMKAEVNTNLIDTTNKTDINGITIEEISGNTFFAKMLIINDPKRVKLATTYP